MKMKQRLLAAIASLCMLFTAMPVSAFDGLGMEESCPATARYDENGGSAECEDTYFENSPSESTGEYQQAMMSLYSTIENEGKMTFSMPGGGVSGGEAGEGNEDNMAAPQAIPAGTELKQDLKITVPNQVGTSNDRDVTLTFSLSEAVDYPVSFRLRTLEGSARAGENFAAQTTTVTFAANTNTAEAVIDIYNDVSRTSGEKLLYILYDQPKYALFDSGNGYSANTRVGITLNQGYNLSMFNSTTNSFSRAARPYYDENLPTVQTEIDWNGSRYWRLQTESDLESYAGSWSRASAMLYLKQDARDLITDGIANKFNFKHRVVQNRSDDYCIQSSNAYFRLASHGADFYAQSYRDKGSKDWIEYDSYTSITEKDEATHNGTYKCDLC